MKSAVRQTKHHISMMEGVIWKQLVRFSIPLLLGDLLQQLYNLTDSMIVGHAVGKAAFAAVGATSPITKILVGFFMGLSIGATALVARCFGARDRERLSRAVYTTVMMTIILGVLLTGIGILFTPMMLRVMNVPEDVFGEAVLYLRIYFGGVLGLVLYNMLSGILRAVGDSRRPLLLLVLSDVLNVVLDLLFVLVFRWGVAGTALATIIAQFLAAGILLVMLSRPEELCAIKWRGYCMDRSMLGEIGKIGLPVAVQKTITAFSNVLVLSYINAYGTNAMAGWSAYKKIDQFVVMPVQSMSTATTTFVSQNSGAKQRERIDHGIQVALGFSFALTVALCVAVYFLCEPIVAMLCPDAAVVEQGVRFLRMIIPLRSVACLNRILAGALRGLGDSKNSVYIMVFSFVVCRQLYLVIITGLTEGINYVVFAYPLSWFICAVLTWLYYRRRKQTLLEKVLHDI